MIRHMASATVLVIQGRRRLKRTGLDSGNPSETYKDKEHCTDTRSTKLGHAYLRKIEIQVRKASYGSSQKGPLIWSGEKKVKAKTFWGRK